MNRKFLAAALVLIASLACGGIARATPIPIASKSAAPAATAEDVESFTDLIEGSPEPLAIQASGAERDVTYCTMEGVELKMDIYFPNNAASARPLVIFIHGGGWSTGDKADGQGRHEGPALVQAGFTVASLNYRLAPEYHFPAMIEDVKCAIRSLRAHADEYNIDPNRIGVWGNSAGGHLANLIGLTDAGAGFEVGEYLDQSSRVQAVVDMFGPADLTEDFSQAFASLKKEVFADFDLAKASPITYISPDDPPFLILQGDQDPVMPLRESQKLYEAMLADGMDVEMTIVVGGDHGFTTPNATPSRAEITESIVKFFLEHLR